MDRRVAGKLVAVLALALAQGPLFANGADGAADARDAGGPAAGPISHVEGPQQPLQSIERWQAPAFDHRAATAEPIVKGQPVQVGRRFPVDVTTSNSGDWEALAGGGRVWRKRFASRDALWLVLGFDRFDLPPGATLYLVGQGGKHVQTYTHDHVQPHGQLWAAPVPGDEVTVELHWPRELSRQDVGLHLAYVSHGYRPFGAIGRESTDKAYGDSGACNIDVACPEGDDWRDEIRGAVLILRNGTAHCSGSLINNAAEDCTNYVLTANHCFSAASGPTMTFQFNFERPGCASGLPGAAQVVTGGATFRAAAADSDFYLAEMLGAIPASFNPYYNGWSRSTTPATGSTGIHHPSGDAKKISINTDPLVSSGELWEVTEWEFGTTEGGSSGSPLFDQNHRIVGQLFGGLASCNALNQYDVYGKVSSSWEGGGTPATRLRDWLDPGASGLMTQPGKDFTSCGMGSALITLQASQVDDSTGGNGDGVVESGESITLTVNAANNGSVTATSVEGSLATTTPGVTVQVPDARFPDIAAGASASSLAPHFVVVVDPAFACGDVIDLDLELTAAEASFATQSQLTLPTGVEQVDVQLNDDLEQGSGNWTVQSNEGTSPWALTSVDSNSPSSSWHVVDSSTRNDQLLVMDAVPALPADAVLSFYHRYNTEATWDGGVLEYQVNNGSWLDAGSLITVGGYTGALRSEASSNLAGRAAWSGSSGGWSEVRADLSTLAGNDVRFRWRMASDGSIGAEGWYVDDIQIAAVTYICSAVAPGEAAGPGGGAPFTIENNRGLFTLAWSAPASGASPAGYRLYATPLGGPYAPTCEAVMDSDTEELLASLSDNSGFLIVAVNGAGEGSYGRDSSGTERVHASGADVCP